MKLISWNVNGLNASIKSGLIEFIMKEKYDVFCFQETKVSNATLDPKFNEIKDYFCYWNPAEKNGYAGTMILSKLKPLSITNGIDIQEFDKEGRVQTFEFSQFYLLNCYFPNAGRDLPKLPDKLRFNSEFLKYCDLLKMKKPLIICGDWNVSHTELDLKNPKQNMKNAGFTPEERAWLTKFLSQGYIDTFREFNKEGGHYTWWSYRNDARARNIGWRLDYWIISSELRNNLKQSLILPEIYGSDHCPILLELEL